MNHVPSLVHNARRVRVVGGLIHLRPPSESFHEFLAELVGLTFGKEWWDRERGVVATARHVVLDWWEAFTQASRRTPMQTVLTEHASRFQVQASGPAMALLTLGYDMHCLLERDRLPATLLDRLRNHQYFQAARHELAAAAIMVRSGFSIDYLDGLQSNERRCELIATCATGGVRLAVEAKSRVRPGALHEGGELACTGDVRGFTNLLRKAIKQSVEGLPLVVFLDVNMPPTRGVAAGEKAWVRDLNAAADGLERRADDKAGLDPYALIVATNFGLHFGNPEGDLAAREFGFIQARQGPPSAAHDDGIQRVMRTALSYTALPIEI